MKQAFFYPEGNAVKDFFLDFGAIMQFRDDIFFPEGFHHEDGFGFRPCRGRSNSPGRRRRFAAEAWVSEKKRPPPCRGGSLANDRGMGISSERPLQGRGVVGLCTQAGGGEAPPPAWAVRTTPTGSKSILLMKGLHGRKIIPKLHNCPKIKEKILYGVALRCKESSGHRDRNLIPAREKYNYLRARSNCKEVP